MGKYQMPRDFRDVSAGIAKIREFLLGRKYVNAHRFPPLISPRSIPPPDIPRGPDSRYSDMYYCNRDVMNSVKPPVVAPVATGATKCFPSRPGGANLKFPSELPTPGGVWWFDAHCYYKEVHQVPCGGSPKVPGPPRATSPCQQPPPPKEATKVKAVCEAPSVCDPCCKEDTNKDDEKKC